MHTCIHTICVYIFNREVPCLSPLTALAVAPSAVFLFLCFGGAVCVTVDRSGRRSVGRPFFDARGSVFVSVDRSGRRSSGRLFVAMFVRGTNHGKSWET